MLARNAEWRLSTHRRAQRLQVLVTAFAVALGFMVSAAAMPARAVTQKDIDALLAHPYYGYNIIIQIDKGLPGTSLHAQRVRVHRYDPETKSLSFVGRWFASTGVETPEIDEKGRLAKRVTHAGYYNVNFLERDAYSDAWDGPMPYATYWDYNQGFAIHATEEFNYFKLGRRASAGCTRLQAQYAIKLFNMVEDEGKGPVLKLDRATGKPELGANGKPIVIRSYKALVLIQENGTLEPTRFGFRQSDEVFRTPTSYYDYVIPPLAQFRAIPPKQFAVGPVTGDAMKELLSGSQEGAGNQGQTNGSRDGSDRPAPLHEVSYRQY